MLRMEYRVSFTVCVWLLACFVELLWPLSFIEISANRKYEYLTHLNLVHLISSFLDGVHISLLVFNMLSKRQDNTKWIRTEEKIYKCSHINLIYSIKSTLLSGEIYLEIKKIRTIPVTYWNTTKRAARRKWNSKKYRIESHDPLLLRFIYTLYSTFELKCLKKYEHFVESFSRIFDETE